ncbi:MAG: hypothetical protein SCALA702_24160 [Melioribacteraceae bacterium]|nr:MAG: hypothetical protein SCALA702_24160 [Melioribacteraceae bacterium]
MKFFKTLFFVVVLFFSANSQYSDLHAQTRNPVLEFCTGTWCQWCPCGHDVIENQVYVLVPNAIVIAYHGGGSDPWKNFNGNEVMSMLGLTSYPSGTVDRTIAPVSRNQWPARMINQKNQPATVDINSNLDYNPATRELNMTVDIVALEELTGDYYLNVLLLENGLVYAQTGNGSCTGGSNYIHDHVVRDMINGALGDTLNNGEVWAAGDTITVEVSTIVSENYIDMNCDIVAFVYENASPLNVAEIQQGEQYKLREPDHFSVSYENTELSDTLGAEMVFYVEIENTAQDTITMDIIRTMNDLPDSWTSSLCFDVCFPPDVDSISTTSMFASSPIAPGETRELSLHFFSIENEGTGTVKLAIKEHENSNKVDTITVTATAIKLVSVEDDVNIAGFSLGQNYPNPFNPETTINFEIPEAGNAEIAVFNLLGQKVAEVYSGYTTAGTHSVSFNAEHLSSGVYVYKLTTTGNTISNKMSVLK